MSTPSLTDLYSFSEILCGENSSLEEKAAAYKSVLLGTKGGEKEKRLACQFIARFSNQFDDLKEESFGCILDVCDDDDPNTRKQAVHDLLQFCKRFPLFIPRVADVIVQMFQTEDTSELHVLSLSLSQLLHLEPKSTLAGIFNQLLTVNPENPRDHILKFLVERLKTLPESKMTADVEEFIADQAHKVLHDVSEEEFSLIIGVLSSLKCMSTVLGRQKLVSMITEQALQACPEFSPIDPACVAQIRESGKQVALCVSKNVHAKEFFTYLLAKVIPKITEISDGLEDDRLALLRVTADLSISHATDLAGVATDEIEKYLSVSFEALVKILPEVPDPIQSLNEYHNHSDANSKKKLDDANGIKFSELECLLCICCQLAKTNPTFFGGYNSEAERDSPPVKVGASRLCSLRPRLQYLSRLAQEYAQSIAGALTLNGKTEETKTKVVSHKLATNIQTLVRSFFHNPPMFKHAVSLSWLQPTAGTVLPGSKRPVLAPEQVTLPTDHSLKSRRDLPRYVPPAGQWSRLTRNSGPQGSSRGFRGRRW